MVHLHIYPDVLGKAAHIQLGLLASVEVAFVAEDGVVAFRIVLD